MTILNVRRIGFYGKTGDDRSPEDFPFPAAMTSIMEYLGEDAQISTIHAHGRSYTKRAANDDFVSASGVGFALLWDKGFCMSAMDTLQACPYDKGIENAFAWSGWQYARVSGPEMQQAAVDAICAGKPFIALGLTDVPEAALVCGCSENGDALYGWSHYQAGMETIENGMFVKKDWVKNTWELIIPTERSQRTITVRDVISEGVRILSQNETEGYLSGFAAYDHWISEIVSSKGTDSRLFGYHHAVLFNLAEARCWCGDFLLKHGVEAGKHFKNIHDLCWKADAAVHTEADMAEDEKKQALIGVMKAIREEDRAALNELKAML